jgi:AbrB family looped-hinge helix DNA binding protein
MLLLKYLTGKNSPSSSTMATLATTKLSSKGQVVIPESVRNELGLQPGAQFVVLGQGNAIILKAISKPSPAEFQAILKKARQQARKAGMKKSDIEAAIRKVRKRA